MQIRPKPCRGLSAKEQTNTMLRGEPFDFWGKGGGWLENLEKNSLKPPKEGKKIMHGKLQGKKYYAWTVRQKKIPANHRHCGI